MPELKRQARTLWLEAKELHLIFSKIWINKLEDEPQCKHRNNPRNSDVFVIRASFDSFVIRLSDFVIFVSMTPARLQTIEEIFRAALDQAPDQVAQFLEVACKGDELLRRKVEALLTSRERADSFIETSAVGLATRIIQNGEADSLVGHTIGHYKISEAIGAGGMGEVYLATDITAGRKAALKLLPARFTGDAERLKRFQQEAHAVVALNHPNILTVYEIGEDHSTYYIASELIEGETLRQRLTRGRLQVGEAVDVAIQVASALAAAHQGGIVHRDIKPENIMLRPDGYAKVLDFGIAKLAEQELPATMPRDEALSLAETNLGVDIGNRSLHVAGAGVSRSRRD